MTTGFGFTLREISLRQMPEEPVGDDRRLAAALDSMRRRGLASIRVRVDPAAHDPIDDAWRITIWSDGGVWSRRTWRVEAIFALDAAASLAAESVPLIQDRDKECGGLVGGLTTIVLTVWSSAVRGDGTQYVPAATGDTDALDALVVPIIERYLAGLYLSRVAGDGADLLGMPLAASFRPTAADLWDDNFMESRTMWCDPESPVGLRFLVDQWGCWWLDFAPREEVEPAQVTLFQRRVRVYSADAMRAVIIRLSRAALLLLVQEERERIGAAGSDGSARSTGPNPATAE